jgi:trigger factor
MANMDTDVAEDALQNDVEGAETGSAGRLEQTVAVQMVGPCRRHVTVTIPRSDIDSAFNRAVKELIDTVRIPGFRPGRVPRLLVEKKFKEDITGSVRQNLLMRSLEQVADENDLDAINEPDFDMESLSIPEEGDFTYEFDVEVRPEFTLPSYKGLAIERPTRELTEADFAAEEAKFLRQFARVVSVDGAVEPGHIIEAAVSATWNGQELLASTEQSLVVRPTLRFQDAEIAGFDKLMSGATIDDVRTTEVKISSEAARVETRGETVQVSFKVLNVQTFKLPELTAEFAEANGFETVEKVKEYVRESQTRQLEYEQRQAARKQVLSKITESATWDLPESLVRRQVDNALRREVLEMQQAGFSDEQISARRNELLQQQITMTRQALKEHFVLDRISDEEKLEVTPQEIDMEVYLMALRRGESPRKMRARLEKQGLMENLAAQVLERKAIDFIVSNASFTDVPAPVDSGEETVEAVSLALCGESLGSAAAMAN